MGQCTPLAKHFYNWHHTVIELYDFPIECESKIILCKYHFTHFTVSPTPFHL